MTNARLVILFLGTLVLLATGGVIYLSSAEKGIPDVLVALATGGLGALGSLLAKTSDTPQVNVEPPSKVEVNTESGLTTLGVLLLVVLAVVVVVLLTGQV